MQKLPPELGAAPPDGRGTQSGVEQFRADSERGAKPHKPKVLPTRRAIRASLARARRRSRSLAVLILSLLIAAGGLIIPSVANAVSTVYEIEGEWSAGTPNPVKAGTVLTSVWRYNINDADPAPLNPPQENVTITFTAQHAKFTQLPDACLKSAVPASEIRDAGATLVCNLGTRNLGTAELLIAGMISTGTTGEKVTVSAQIGQPGVNQVSATLPELPVVNPFAMDMKFDAGNPGGKSDGPDELLWFPWSLRHAPGSTPGPNTVSYDLTFTNTGGEPILLGSDACRTLDTYSPGHPNSGVRTSGAAFPASQTAPFPTTCTLVQTGPNTFRLTLAGIDYSKTTVPTTDSTGVALPTDWDVVASGLINVKFTYVNGGTVSFTSSAPTYTSTAQESSKDLASNNSNSSVVYRGGWGGGWDLWSQDPPAEGSPWTDTFRTMAGLPTQQVTATARDVQQASGVCTTLDTKYGTFQKTKLVQSAPDGTPLPGVILEYYVGTNSYVDPANAAYDPNLFRCDGSAGWVTTLPADLSTVKAVRATIAAGVNPSINGLDIITTTIVKPDVPVGTDIWVWSSVDFGDGWYNPDRSMNPADADGQVLTPNSRYPFAGAGRDVLRIVNATPSITKTTEEPVSSPGATVNYTVKYRLEAPANKTVDGLEITDILPAGLTYVPGSASVAPSSINGQELRWNLDGVQTNTDYTILLSATIASDASPATTYTNEATAAFGGVTKTATADVRIRDTGYTFLTKTADNQRVPHTNGVAQDGWTVRITSADSKPQAFTDTIDILPYNGDGRGTKFAGSYALSGPVTAVPGANVYYSTAAPGSLNDDPADASNGSVGSVTGNSAGWTTTFTPGATAVRVIGPALAPGASQSFKINVTTSGASFEDMYVNRAEARAERTELVMRTSAWFQIAAANSVTIKKYVQDSAGVWHDAQNIDDYPSFHNGETAKYRLVVTNTGDQKITNLKLSDDKVDLAALEPLPAGLSAGAVIPELLPGNENAATFEYDVVLTGLAAGSNLINNACVTPEDTSIVPSCDPAGVKVLPSSLTWEKVNAGNTQEFLEGSEWELVGVDQDQNPTGPPLNVVDCVAAVAADCTGDDKNPQAGKFMIDDLPDGQYRLVETRAPAGYLIDPTPHYVTVQGNTALPLPITNDQAPPVVIPLSGGVGTFSILLGSGLAAGLAVLLILMRRRKTENS